jgi:hypothetical protein
MPLDWGRREYVTEELGDAFELAFFEGESPQRGESPESLWELFSASVGPLKAMSESLDDDRRPTGTRRAGAPAGVAVLRRSGSRRRRCPVRVRGRSQLLLLREKGCACLMLLNDRDLVARVRNPVSASDHRQR